MAAAPLASAALIALLASGCRTAAPRPGAGQATPAPRPRLLVLVVIDQLPAWSFERDRALLDGGIGRMLREGVYYPRAELPYAITFTAPGHAALGTGAPPSESHILSNEWYRPALGRAVSAVEDPESPVLIVAEPSPESSIAPSPEPSIAPSGKPAQPPDTLSGVQLHVDGLAEALRAATGGKGRSVSIALKDRGAAFMLGRRPDLAVWYEPEQLAMTTSAYYAAELPAWLRGLHRTHPIAPRLATVWTPLPGVDHAAVTGGPDEVPGEGAEHGMGIAFPHDIGKSSNPGKALMTTPLGNELVIEAALAAIEGESLGADDVPDLLALSFSAHDYAGHNWGQESWERLDLFLRLDDALGEFFAELDRRIGKDRYAVVLSSDHGATRLVERTRAAGRPAHRVMRADVLAAAERAAASVLGPGRWMAEISASTVYVAPAFAAQARPRYDAALDAVVAAIAAMDGVGYAARTDRIAGSCGARAGVDALACRSVVPGLSGEIFYTPAEDCLSTSTYVTGTGHGSHNPDDRLVPLIVMAPGRPPRTAKEPATILQVAPTIAELARIPRPAAAQAPPLAP